MTEREAGFSTLEPYPSHGRERAVSYARLCTEPADATTSLNHSLPPASHLIAFRRACDALKRRFWCVSAPNRSARLCSLVQAGGGSA